jgi:ectoine hydroxylase-related dioxygenase (phytanoyl-CoA dioxygenase family)
MSIEPRQKALWLYELQLNGFIVLRNFVPVDLVRSMREQFEPLLQGELSRLSAGDGSTLRGTNRLSFDLAPYVDRLKGPLDDDWYRRNPVIEELATAVLGRWRYGVSKAEVALPDSNTMTWHPDVPNDERRDEAGPVIPTRLTFNVPLVEINDSNGPMEIIPGSHRMHHHHCAEHIYDVPQIYPVRVLLRVGDAMVRDGNGLHRGTCNMSKQPRILLDRTYRALEE